MSIFYLKNPVTTLHRIFAFLLVMGILQGCRRPGPVEKNWGQISVGMDETNVVSLLGYPSAIIPENTYSSWFYRPKRDIPHAHTSELVIDYCIVEFASNKLWKPSFCIQEKMSELKNKRRKSF